MEQVQRKKCLVAEIPCSGQRRIRIENFILLPGINILVQDRVLKKLTIQLQMEHVEAHIGILIASRCISAEIVLCWLPIENI